MKKYYIFIIIVFLFFAKCRYDNYTLKRDKTNILNALINYKKVNQKYPLELSDLNINSVNEFFYKTDSIQQSFRLSYLEGLMDLNCFYFKSENGEWRHEHTE